MEGDDLELTFLHPGEQPPVEIVPADRWRDWMQVTPERFANRCLPLLVANQAGWVLLNPRGFEATWGGGPYTSDVTVVPDEPGEDARENVAASHFGSGILTFLFKCVFRTPPGYNVLARGPANMPKDGIGALEGIVETDWMVVPFTMNWRFTRPGTVRFAEGEPFCQVVPQRRGELESFSPRLQALDDDRELSNRAKAWSATRMLTMLGRASAQKAGEEGYHRIWMPDYFKGEPPTGERSEEHQTTLRLRPFT